MFGIHIIKRQQLQEYQFAMETQRRIKELESWLHGRKELQPLIDYALANNNIGLVRAIEEYKKAFDQR